MINRILLSLFLITISFFKFVALDFDFFIDKRSLKEDLGITLDNSVFLVNNGYIAPLFKNVFSNIFLPLAPNVTQIRLKRTNSEKYRISHKLTSLNHVILKDPSEVIDNYETDLHDVTIKFVCTGLVTGIADVAYKFEVVNLIKKTSEEANINVRKMCLQNVTGNLSSSVKRDATNVVVVVVLLLVPFITFLLLLKLFGTKLFCKSKKETATFMKSTGSTRSADVDYDQLLKMNSFEHSHEYSKNSRHNKKTTNYKIRSGKLLNHAKKVAMRSPLETKDKDVISV